MIDAELRGPLVAGAPVDVATTFAVHDPATGLPVAEVGDGDDDTARAAVDAASVSARGWAATPARDRADVLHRMWRRMLDEQDQLAALIVRENGKALTDARAEVRYAAEFFRWYAEETVRPHGEYGPDPSGSTRLIVTHRPVGVAAAVTPWNFPAAMIARKVAPALGAGCTVVVKPAAETPLTALAMAELLTEVGVPAGAVNVVTTSRAATVVSTWLADERVRKLSFTGSTPVGRQLLAQAAGHVVNCSMELGGNAPFVVAEDADLDLAVRAAMVAKFRNGGQACTAANRFLVHEGVSEAFTAELGRAVEDLRVGPGDDLSTDVGPMITEKAVLSLESMVEAAVARGARVTHRADVSTDRGYFFAPVVLDALAPDDPLLEQEIFGPVAPIVTWRTEEDLLEGLNRGELGLAAYVCTRDLGWGLRIAEAAEAGMVALNRGLVSEPAAPFGGVKQSGIGREGARAGLEEYLETQYFSVDWPA